MISYLKGFILAKENNSLILNVHDVGYLVHIPNSIFSTTETGHEIELFIHTHVREDILALYGFETSAGLNFFKLLLSVSGIGPKIALEIMSSPINLIKNAIFSGDDKTLSKIHGLGKKKAERLILELKNKIEPTFLTSQEKGALPQKINQEAVEALVSLGYSRYQVIKAIGEMKEQLTETEEIVKYFLKKS